MRAEELRIGNLASIMVEDGGGGMLPPRDQKIIAVHLYKFIDFIIEPIPLTEEWLLRFGLCYDTLYSEDSSNCLYYSKDQKVLHIMDSRDENYSYAVDVQYVHQLQNLVFALTNEELKLK